MILTADIGGTHTRVAEIDNGNLVVLEKFPTQRNYNDELHKLCDLFQGSKHSRAGIAIASPIDKGKINPPNIPWGERDIVKDFADCIKTDVIVKNDAEAAALAEARIGAGKNWNDFCYLTWGTGIGGAMIRNHGSSDKNFEPGHTIIIDGLQLEDLIGGKALTHDTEEGEVIKNLSGAVDQINKKYHIKRFVFGGGILLNRPELFEKFRSSYTKENPGISVVKGETGDNAALVGMGLFLAKQPNFTNP